MFGTLRRKGEHHSDQRMETFLKAGSTQSHHKHNEKPRTKRLLLCVNPEVSVSIRTTGKEFEFTEEESQMAN